MRKVRTIPFTGITGSGERIEMPIQVFDPSHLASDELFRASNIPGPNERQMRANPGGVEDVGGDAQNFTPDGIVSADDPTGNGAD